MRLIKCFAYIGLCFVTLFAGFGFQYGGARLNLLVLMRNDGHFPVYVYTEDIRRSLLFDYLHVPLTKQSRLKAFSDIVPVPAISLDGSIGLYTESAGDIILQVGMLLILVAFLIPFIPLGLAVRRYHAKRKAMRRMRRNYSFV